jgi:exodeoxyribonuclease V alpha subunit
MPPLSGHGQMPLASDNPGSDFHLVPCRDAEDGRRQAAADHRIRARFGLDPIRDVQVLCPMNRGGLGTRALNLDPSAGAQLDGRPRRRAVRLKLRNWLMQSQALT